MLLPTQDKEARLTEHEISEALKPYWKPSAQCPTCKNVQQGFYLLSPTERDMEVTKAQIANLEKLGYLKGLPTVRIEESLNSGDISYVSPPKPCGDFSG